MPIIINKKKDTRSDKIIKKIFSKNHNRKVASTRLKNSKYAQLKNLMIKK